ncbi:O-antigen ligase family protein [Flavobacterium sp. SM15]|uniref:O-antigen ligase family protein n=1 Tax=Flavobacterium sp. SM15 TaxID=2908005 RepID=UPI001EDBEAEF|nr:O-antigen ligase family protein [Flavobacterium sp. SM15]MCG2610363.1 O-antigen ligase family protein [Flavobacterium sp. SM15]
MIVFFLFGALSLFWTTNVSVTAKGIYSTLPLAIIPVLLSQYSRFNTSDLRKTIRVFSLCLLLYFLACFINATILFFKDHSFSHFFYHGLVSLFENNAIYISLAVAVCILIGINLPNNTVKDYVVIALLGVFLFFLSSKNIIVSTFFLSLITLFNHKENRKKVLVISTVLLVALLVLIVFDNPVKQRFIRELSVNADFVWIGQDFYNYKFSGFEVRLFQWRIMGEMIQNHQIGIFGLGLYNIDYLLNQYFSYYNLYKGYFYINFHNQYLQTLGELGFIGLGLLFWLFFKAFRFKNAYQLVVIMLFMIAFFTESFLSRQKGVFLFATMYSLVFSFLNTGEEDQKSAINKK